MTAIFRTYDAAGLEREYKPALWGIDVPAVVKDWKGRSREAHARMTVQAGLSYGPGERQRIDLLSRGGLEGAPVLAFLHGGYWRSKDLDRFAYSFALEPVVASGALVAMIDYDLCPDVSMDVLVQQVREACAWLWRNAGRHGGDPSRLHVSGHSAGGHLTAMMAATDWPGLGQDLPADLVRSMVPISGLFDLEPLRLSYLNESLRLDEGEARRNSPILLRPPRAMPAWIFYGGAESDEYRRHSMEFAAAWAPMTTRMACEGTPGHNHFTVIEAMTEPGNAVTAAILRQLGG